MKKILLMLSAILALFAPNAYGQNITTILFDIETIFQTDSFRASGYVGKLNSLRYLSHVGHVPDQKDLFDNLKKAPAQSTQVTYNNNLEMPLILSDWLAKLQTPQNIEKIIQKHLQNKHLSDIELKVFFAIINMMLTPQHLADTQKVRPKIEQVLAKLRQQGKKLYLVGNWAHISSMKTEFPDTFKYFHGVYTSGDLHMLKPSQQYYQTILERIHVNPDNALWVESEPIFKTRAQGYGYHVIRYQPDNPSQLASALKAFGISI